MKKILTLLLGAIVAVLCFSQPALSQEDDGEIHIKITKEIDGERKTLEKTYKSRKEMLDDPEYQEFSGSDNTFYFRFPPHEDVFGEIEHLRDGLGERFHYQFSDDEDHEFFFFDPDMRKELHEDIRKYFKKLEERFEELDTDEISRDLREELKNLREELESLGDHRNRLQRSIRITEVQKGEFDERGTVDNEHRLELEELNFFPNPSEGRFKLRFRTPGEGTLSVSVYDLEGKEVYQTRFQRFGGLFNQSIDLGQQDEGIYLLEIRFDDKRLTRKIIVEN